MLDGEDLDTFKDLRGKSGILPVTIRIYAILNFYNTEQVMRAKP